MKYFPDLRLRIHKEQTKTRKGSKWIRHSHSTSATFHDTLKNSFSLVSFPLVKCITTYSFDLSGFIGTIHSAYVVPYAVRRQIKRLGNRPSSFPTFLNPLPKYTDQFVCHSVTLKGQLLGKTDPSRTRGREILGVTSKFGLIECQNNKEGALLMYFTLVETLDVAETLLPVLDRPPLLFLPPLSYSMPLTLRLLRPFHHFSLMFLKALDSHKKKGYNIYDRQKGVGHRSSGLTWGGYPIL